VAPATLDVTLKPPFWASWWFRLTTVVVLVGAVLGAYRARVHHLEGERRKLERLVGERTAELAESHGQLEARRAELEAANVELQALDEKKNEFLGMAAHDLRGPLGLISGWTGIVIRSLQSGRFGPERAAKELQRVVTVAEQMTRLVSELLDLSAIESGKLRLLPEPAVVQAILEDTTQLFTRLAAEKSIELVLKPQPLATGAVVDRDRIAEVVSNLLSNAIKFTPPGGRVTLWCERVAAEVWTTVEDSGPGLSEEDLRVVFRCFGKLSARPTGGEPSTGLGLAIVKKIVDAHRGRIWVTSPPGEGARFSFSLPATG
jgi:two-component system sensor histidine kinase/response regulator